MGNSTEFIIIEQNAQSNATEEQNICMPIGVLQYVVTQLEKDRFVITMVSHAFSPPGEKSSILPITIKIEMVNEQITGICQIIILFFLRTSTVPGTKIHIKSMFLEIMVGLEKALRFNLPSSSTIFIRMLPIIQAIDVTKPKTQVTYLCLTYRSSSLSISCIFFVFPILDITIIYYYKR